MNSNGTLIFFCGRMGAGKTTLSIRLAEERNGVLLSEDAWLSQLYPKQILSFDDYIKFSNQLKPLVKSHVQNILTTGTDVVMDFPANTKSQREWFKNLFSEIDAPYELIYLEASSELCLKHIAKRAREQPERACFDTEAVFLQVNRYFEEPAPTEGLNVEKIEVQT